ncbi:MAG TPA: hypothetical protein VK465_12165 [Fibrobacteria bacterium]|nr:hypothetical protein [Fibrobacteria bacterium]
MRKILAFLMFAAVASAQVVNRGPVEDLLTEGEISKAQRILENYLGNSDLTYQDSVYILKNLGVLYASNPKRKDLGDRYFSRLLELDPFASIHDTYASNSIIARFKNIRKAYQQQKGGKALVPAVAVFDFVGPGIQSAEGAAMAQQLIAELQRLEVFHALDRSQVVETLNQRRVAPEACVDPECRLDIARRLTVDKAVSVEVGKVDTVYNFTLTYFDVESGQPTTILRKVYAKSLPAVLGEGFGELAAELQDREAAWLNLSVTPINTILTIDGSPMAAISSRVPLNPGKHRICGSSPGYEQVCKDFDVKRADALTYSLVLPLKGGGKPLASSRGDEDEDDEEEEERLEEEEDKGSTGFIWWTLGSMSVLALVLAVVFNTKD